MRSFREWTKVVAASAALLVAAPLWGGFVPELGVLSAEAATVGRVTVVGNTRVEAETVAAYIKGTPGRSLSAAEVDESVKALFATGMFSDVQISQSGGHVTVKVVENPVIARVAFEGNDVQSDEMLKGAVELQPRSVLTQGKVESDTQRILELYRRSGRYDATVEPKQVDLGKGRVDLIYQINEGPRTEVSQITFVGNKAFSNYRLSNVISTKESGLFGWFKSSDNYSPEKLTADQEALRRFYYNHGYADFRVVSATADFDRQQNSFFLTFTVDEGERYKYGDVKVETTLSDVNPDDLKSLALTRPGDTYSAADVDKSLEAITTAVAAKGYAFVQVRPRGDRDYANRTIAVTYFVDEGTRAYIERINIIGNDRTRDYVIRREFDIGEGDAYNQVLIEKAERRLKNLGYFRNVRIWSEQGSSVDKVIVNVQVDDKPTGEVSIGAGYSTSNGILAELSLTEKNFLGRGQYVRASVSRGITTDGKAGDSSYELSFTEPYLFDRRLEGGFDIYQRNYTDGDDGVHPYDEKTTGGKIRFGVPLDDNTTLGLFYEGYRQKISDVQSPYGQFVETENRFISIVGASLTYNTIDDFAFPRNGVYAQVKQEFAGVGGDATFLRTTARAEYYKELVEDWDLIGHVGAKGGAMFGMDGDLASIDQFQVGGSIIRGFDANGIGPRDPATGYAFGGKYYVAASAETIFPVPFIPQEYGFWGSLFADAGTLWSTDAPTAGTDNSLALRASVGAGLMWQSPFGLLRADFAYPVMKEDTDRTQVFRFSGGTKF
ncbi:outer membrane protein assembly factor BamA [Pleomorphomonas diazotrophica]|uniref:Outer membrane protein assembly factor BamA n=1 Tax=Pleomorphomonas diazotrophica TaxID=1166257 RepID=A0A1I4TS35_9HYPH|nr:outer membrane protein assembly factor BamA [Pleomorphomonas diazotrophica]SFM79367.1 Beta-barrel assembly machine subunit BamA [Pleomorphomonas diazotrophica]